MKWQRIALVVLFILSGLGFAFSVLDESVLPFLKSVSTEPWFIDIKQHWSPPLTILLTLLTLWGAYRELVNEISDKVIRTVSSIKGIDGSGHDLDLGVISNKVSEIAEKVFDVVSSIKGVDPLGHETDVIRKVMEYQLGQEVSNILFQAGQSFPMSLSPCGDVALVMSQGSYSRLLNAMLDHAGDWPVKWTTFVPFESLNRGLAYSKDNWDARMDPARGPAKVQCGDGNARYFDFVARWNTLKNGQQILILARPSQDRYHPVSWDKYKRGGEYNLDLIKYLSVRYGVVPRNDFLDNSESEFLQAGISLAVKDADTKMENVRWTLLDRIDELGIDLASVHSLDFVYFDGPGTKKLCLVRVDPTSYYGPADSGVFGLTVIVAPSVAIETYDDLFRQMWASSGSVQTFRDLTKGAELA